MSISIKIHPAKTISTKRRLVPDTYLKNFSVNLESLLFQKDEINELIIKKIPLKIVADNLNKRKKPRFQTRSKGLSRYLQNRADDVEIIPSKIIAINHEKIVFECVTDVKNQCYETREFPMILFEKYRFLKVGLVCNLNITLSPNNSHLKITNLDDLGIKKLFDTSDLFDELEGFENIPYR
jgi:hypothetical protein